uniref:Small ribosomal subunit protein mS35 mitochondrial conserved domain-containing protein n=1 Tax=Oncorhynchus tshawytscha TaxID=74940 RepID=A0A8C8FYD2_ONCTS
MTLVWSLAQVVWKLLRFESANICRIPNLKLSTSVCLSSFSLFPVSMVCQAGDPRTDRMPVDQDWTAVYPTAAPFRQGSVPLPVRMGFPVKRGVPPEKKGNLELIKIPNFLHLTPAAIKKHCEARSAQWPSALDTDAKYDEHFPVKVKSKDYMSAGTAHRNPSTHIVHLRVKLSSLNLDNHARKKMVKLVGERYCKETDTLTITRQVNSRFMTPPCTVLYHESWKAEAWESEKTVADMGLGEQPLSEERPVHVGPHGVSRGGKPEVQEYRDSVTRLKNEGESEGSVLQYREAGKKLLNL